MEHKIFLFGLQNAGKTTLMKYLKKEPDLQTKPTLAFNIDELIIRDIKFIVWDAPGQVKMRDSWNKGLDKAKILLFVLDAADDKLFETCSIPLVFCFHKMDLEDAKNDLNKAQEKFKLPSTSGRKVYKFETSVKIPEGVENLKDRLVNIIQEARWG